MYVRFDGNFVSSKVVTTKSGKPLQINKFMEGTGGIITLMGDTVMLKSDDLRPLIPYRVEGEITLSNYEEKLSLRIEKISVKAWAGASDLYAPKLEKSPEVPAVKG